MAKTRSRSNAARLMSSLSHDILKILKDEFIEDGRSSDDLRDGYIGLNMNHLQEQILGRGSVSRVDYDLALKELEDGGLVKTGPMTMYDNPPNSHVLVIAMFSKREYIYLTEAGYKVARDMAKNMDRPQSRQNVHISGGHFYQSPIGVGAQVSQQINFDVSSESDSVKYLAELLAQSGKQVDEATKTDLTEMVRAANTGNMTAAKPIFQRIYGMVAEPIKQLAYGVLAAIIAKQMGI